MQSNLHLCRSANSNEFDIKMVHACSQTKKSGGTNQSLEDIRKKNI